ncbi:hypothetical protein RRG08_042748 [Elysia crispata]|uniref:Uncharacterized protein n=1 Tax=Elysia crispata TaxID=231223 RepID=A0AAE0XQ60_9GAST|nr:hypothetical protein RRG08_042748 [Elysia crispata]
MWRITRRTVYRDRQETALRASMTVCLVLQNVADHKTYCLQGQAEDCAASVYDCVFGPAGCGGSQDVLSTGTGRRLRCLTSSICHLL